MGLLPCLEFHAAWTVLVEWSVCLPGIKKAGFSAYLLYFFILFFINSSILCMGLLIHATVSVDVR